MGCIMKEEKGITLGTITIYVIALLIIVGLISTITSFFYSNIINVNDNSRNMAQITKFNMYFLNDIKNANNTATVSVDNTNITFSSGNVYIFKDNAIYQNKVKICDNVKNAQFKLEEKDNKKIVTVLLSIGDNLEVTRTTKYVMARI